MFRLERWTAGRLLGSWVAYWVGLVGVSIGPGLLAAWRLTREPGSHGTMSASLAGGHLLLKVNDATGAAGAWAFDTSVAAALAWIALPPLALWVLWLIKRPQRNLPRPAELPMLDAPPTDVPTLRRAQPEHVERQS